MIDATFIKELRALAAQSLTPAVVTIPGQPAHVQTVWNPAKGELQAVTLDIAPRNHQAHDLETAMNAVAENKDTAAVWYNRDAVVVLLDDAVRRDRVTLELPNTPQFNWLVDNDKPTKLSQADLLFLLRTTFKDCLPYGSSLFAQLRKVNWKQLKDAESEIAKNKASIGKAIKSELAGAEDLPEYVTLNVPVFNVSGLMKTFDVECVLESSPADEKFIFFPTPGAVEKAYQEAEAWLCGLLAEGLAERDAGEVAVNHGTP